MSTADKLNALVQTKADIKQALIDKGQNPSDVFSSYADDIRAIETGGGVFDFASIGYTGNEEPIKSGLLYAKQIKDNWTNTNDCRSLFNSDKNLYIFPDIDLSNVGALNFMFADSNLIMIPAFKFKDGADLTGMFSNCYSLITTPQIDYSNVTSLSILFERCSNLQNVGTIDCSNATKTDAMFNNCYNLTYNPCINTNKVTYIYKMFYNCINLNDPDFSNFNTQNVTNMRELFCCDSHLNSKVKKIDISNFDTSNTTDMQSMFKYQKALETVVLPENFGSACKIFRYMFGNCKKLRSIGFINSVSATDMSCMFEYLDEIRRIEGISVKSMTKMGAYDIFGYSGDCPTLRYFVCKDIGTQSSVTSVQFTSSKLPNWGVVDEEQPDAKQSVIDSLITYSYDRAAAGYSTCTVNLSNNTKALLTEDEIAQITAKGYTIA